MPKTIKKIYFNDDSYQIGGEVTGVKGLKEESYRTGDVNISADNVGAVPAEKVGQPNGVATLDAEGKIPSSSLPDSAVSAGTYGQREDATGATEFIIPEFTVNEKGQVTSAKDHIIRVAAPMSDITVQVPQAGWQLVGAEYTQTLDVKGIYEGFNPVILCNSATEAERLSFGQITHYGAGVNKLTQYADWLPTSNFSLVIKNVPSQEVAGIALKGADAASTVVSVDALMAEIKRLNKEIEQLKSQLT